MKIRNDFTIAGLSGEETAEFLIDDRYGFNFNNIEDFLIMKKQEKRLKKLENIEE